LLFFEQFNNFSEESLLLRLDSKKLATIPCTSAVSRICLSELCHLLTDIFCGFQIFKRDFDVRLSHSSTFDQLKTQSFSERAYSTSASSGDNFSPQRFATIF
jgi:hypothetical protein